MYLGADRQRIREQYLDALPDLFGLALRSRRDALAIADDDEGTHQCLTLGRTLRDFGRYGVAIARPILDHAPNHGERHHESHRDASHDYRLQQHVRPHATDPPVSASWPSRGMALAGSIT